MTLKSSFAILFSCWIILPPMTTAQMYKWTDENGNLHISDRPHPGAQTVRLESTPNIPTSRKQPAAAMSSAEALRITEEREQRLRDEIAQGPLYRPEKENELVEFYRANSSTSRKDVQDRNTQFHRENTCKSQYGKACSKIEAHKAKIADDCSIRHDPAKCRNRYRLKTRAEVSERKQKRRERNIERIDRQQKNHM